MTGRVWGLMSLWMTAIVMVSAPVVGAAVSQHEDEQQIRALQVRLAAAVTARDLNGVMKEYAPGNELFVFDSDLPRQHIGWESFKKDWGNFVDSAESAKYDIQDLGITVVGNAAFSHHLAHIAWTSKKDGSHHEQLMSMTDAYRKTDGKWLIVLEHFSLPVVDGKAVFMARP